MKRKLIIMLAAVATMVSGGATAQNSFLFGGLLVERERLNPMDVFSIAQTDYGFGTARSMAMGGAFTSLGADMTSLTLNPAGLGMYRQSEVSFTPLVTLEQSASNAAANLSNKVNRFSAGNLGVVINAYQGTGSVLSLSIGFGYTRTADYNYDYSFYQTGNASTLGGVLAQQLNASAGNIYINQKNQIADRNGNTDFGLSSELWGGVLGYKCGLLNRYDNGWGLDEYPMRFTTDQYTTVKSRGSAGEYTVALGMNINNKLYVGAALGIQSIRRKQTLVYGEDINAAGNVDPVETPYVLHYFDYAQWSEVSGTGVNFKLGLTWRPTESLRLGFALHTPTYYSLDFSYDAGMDSASKSIGSNPGGYQLSYDGYVLAEESTPVINDYAEDTWEFSSPTRMMFGASYTFGSVAVVSVDYERDWYNGIRMKNMPLGFARDYYDDYFRTAFKGSNNLRMGVEFKPSARLSLRAGYGFSGSMLRDGADNDLLYMTPVVYRTNYWSAGLGYAFTPRVTLDAAYRRVTGKTTDYSLFYAMAVNGSGNIDLGASDYSGVFSTTLHRHEMALTLSVKF